MWKSFDGPEANSWNKRGKDRCLAIPRHGTYDVTLEQADYVQNVKNIDSIRTNIIYLQKGSYRKNLFWLITAGEAPFVYAILKSSMFKAWCELTAHEGKGNSRHFTEGMWNTFPLPALTDDLKKNMSEAGKNQEQLDKIVDALFNLPCSATDEDRKSMLASGFYETFQGI